MRTARTVDELLQALQAERAALAALVCLLEREQSLLVAGDAVAIEQISDEKEQAARRAESLGGARAVLAARPDPAQGDAAAQAWRALLAEAQRARSLNEANGRLIAVQAGFVQARLASLVGTAVGAGYGPAGPIAPPSPARELGAA